MNARPLLLGLVAVGLAACGGGGSETPNASESRLDFAPGPSYNGTSAPIVAGNAATTTADGRVTATIHHGTRTVRVTFPARQQLSNGQVYAVGGEFGTTVVYSEVQDRDAMTFTWIGSGGTVRIRAVNGPDRAEIEISGATLTSDLSIVGNPANGSFSLNGNIEGVRISGSGDIGGDANLSFSEVTDVNADTSSLSAGVVAYLQVNGRSVLTTASGSLSLGRVLTVNLGTSAVAGDQIALTGLINSKGFVSFVSGNGSTAKTWLATSGTLRVHAKGATTARVELVNARFVGSQGGAAGTFNVNGTIETD